MCTHNNMLFLRAYKISVKICLYFAYFCNCSKPAIEMIEFHMRCEYMFDLRTKLDE